MSDYLYQTNCKACGSSDALTVYEDHVYCFSCRFYQRTKSINPKLIKKAFDNKNDNSAGDLGLPVDCRQELPLVALDWLKQYNITAQDIHEHHFCWSEEGKVIRRGTPQEQRFSPCLVFPVYDPFGNLVMWQGRYFGTDPRVVKYYHRGAKDTLHIIGKSGIIVLVEDIISAIRVSKVARACPLFGSSINLDFLIRLHGVTNEFLIWLDADMGKKAQGAAERATQFFDRVGVIQTELDPKCYKHEEIERIVNEIRVRR